MSDATHYQKLGSDPFLVTSDSIVVDNSTVPAPPSAPAPPGSATAAAQSSWLYALGLFFIGLFVLIAVFGALMVQEVFKEFKRPFVVTLVETFVFSLYLVVYLIQQCCLRNVCTRGRSTPLRAGEGSGAGDPGMMTLRGHLHTAFILAPLWSLISVLYNLALGHTSMASNTILSATSGLWVMVLGLIFQGTRLQMWPALAMICTLGGAILVAFSTPPTSDPDAPKQSLPGDAAAATSALVYAVYSLSLDRFMGDETAGAAATDADAQAEAAAAAAAVAVKSKKGGMSVALLSDDGLSAAEAGHFSAVAAVAAVEAADAQKGPLARFFTRSPGKANMLMIFGFMGMFNFLYLLIGVVSMHFAGVQKLFIPSDHTVLYVKFIYSLSQSLLFYSLQNTQQTRCALLCPSSTLSLISHHITDNILPTTCTHLFY